MAEDDASVDTPQLSDTDTSEDETEQQQIETLVAGRERRKTAGNRYDRDMILEETGDEDEPDEVTLLFADIEEEEDEEFKSGDDDADADMSSSDDDDQGPNAAVEDMEGEQELQKQAKVERAKKRKADLALTSVAGLRKKLKTDPTRPGPVAAPPRPSKKKERVTWVHDPDSGRSSLRKQTIAHRAETIERLKQSEAQSKKLKALKEKRDRERAKDAPKELTQSDRLAEAAKIERQNAKSLNRWEALEKKRQEEQAAKLAALKDRKLEGPVVSWWSAKATWVGPKLSKIGTKDAGDILEAGPELKKRGRKSKAFLEQQAAAKGAESLPLTASSTAESGTTMQGTTPQIQSNAVPEAPPAMRPNTETKLDTPTTKETTSTEPPPAPLGGSETTTIARPEATNASQAAPQSPSRQSQKTLDGVSKTAPTANNLPLKSTGEPSTTEEDFFLKGIHEYASMQAESNASESNRVSPDPKEPGGHGNISKEPDVQANPEPTQSELKTVQSEQDKMPEQRPTTSQSIKGPNPVTELEHGSEAQTATVPSLNPGMKSVGSGQTIDASTTPIPTDQTQQSSQSAPKIEIIKLEAPPEASPFIEAARPEPTVEYSLRNLVFLEKFDELSDQARQEYALFYNNRKTAKPVKHNQELCPITTLPARYRDPSTGIGYANVVGYKKLQELKEHKFIWSSMLGCYVGRDGGQVARGVPEGFVDKT
ncbi:hypothetical protein LTR72_009889 [Exophiala xenobiotica]|nr:hypothetical protein LTR72_009889 [Exophiala xenobiotica]KAK5287380.1 hypothetical protein LTR14_009042 [Exophiala xenobiotica]KAK5474710.1 hypothetical protein LTR55_009638 [Exophiala xenobiotica]